FFNENKPSRNEPPVINTVPGAMAIQTYLDRLEWAGEAGNLSAYAGHLRTAPLNGLRDKSVLFHFSSGDQGAPNVNMSRMLVAAGLADRATYYRHDLAYPEHAQWPKDSHLFT